MDIVVKFIRAYHYDFVDESTGERKQGNTMMCYDSESDSIIRVVIDNLDAILDKFDFGSDVNLEVVPNGRYVKYNYNG